MPKLNKRTCPRCRSYEETFSKAVHCATCYVILKKEQSIKDEAKLLNENNYSVISGPWLDKFNHRCYKVKTPCDHEWEAPFTNMLKQIKNSQTKGLRPACGVCGPQHRFAKALEKYVEKYGVDYDLNAFNDYRKKVRSLTEVVYRNNKNLINPNNLPRGHHEYHLDHIVPIIECFKRGLSAEEAARPENLQMLHCKENLAKGGV